MLIEVYTKCIDGPDEAARRRIADAPGDGDEDSAEYAANFAAYLP